MLSQDFKQRMKTILGNEYDDFIKSYDKPQFHALRMNPLKNTDSTQIEKYFAGHLKPVEWCKTGFYYDEEVRPGKHPYHEAGAYYIQEPSAMLPGELLDVHSGQTVLDLCAAPGGKSTQIAGKMNGEGLLISNEIIPSRAKILSENIERMGIRNAIVTNEDSNKLRKFFPEFFDRIMVDAPCSGEGMFRKNELATDEWSVDNVILCAERQAEILDNAAVMLKPGGRMVYSTCTFAPEENEESILHFLERHENFHIVEVPKTEGMADGDMKYCLSDMKESSEKNKADIRGAIRLFPHKIDGEGHFVCVLEKDAVPNFEVSYKEIKGLKEKSLKDYLDFAKKFLNTQLDGKYIMFGDNLYLVPDNCPNLDKLKVLRAGLHLGTFLKNRFEPSHSLALALHEDEVTNVVNLSVKEDTVYRYIGGETFEYDGEKGWYLICVDGYSIGFGKLAGGVMKNHYPKGLRKRLK